MKSSLVLVALIGFALINTVFLGVYLATASGLGGPSYATTPEMTVTSATSYTVSGTLSALSTATPASQNGSSTADDGASFAAASTSAATGAGLSLHGLTQFFETHSLVLAPTSWFFVGGMWIWRGRMKSKWTDLGFDSDVFGLFVRMRGAKTRIRLLDALSVPKDRLQLAQELGLDWKAVDRHVTVLHKYGFIEDRVAYGKVRMYELTPVGRSLLHLLEELSKGEVREVAPMSPALEVREQA